MRPGAVVGSPGGAIAAGARRRHRLGVGIGLTLLLALVAACADGPAPRPAAPDAAVAGRVAEPPRGGTFLWTIASPTATVHLLGSIHLASRDIYPLDPRIEGTFRRASVLVIETPLDPAAQREAARKFAQVGMYPPDDALDRHVRPDLIAALEQRLPPTGLPFGGARRMRPWLLATVLVLREMQRLGYEPAYGIDKYFADQAVGRKAILTLETLDEQIAVFAGMPDRVQEALLAETLGKLDQLGPLMATALRLWQAGDAAGLDRALVAPTRTAYPELFQRIFLDRNRRMVDAVAGYLRGGGESFVVVGAGHLVGPGGMLDLVRARGYQPVQR
jgi:uncharacterized protein YbaP (TraB family)